MVLVARAPLGSLWQSAAGARRLGLSEDIGCSTKLFLAAVRSIDLALRFNRSISPCHAVTRSLITLPLLLQRRTDAAFFAQFYRPILLSPPPAPLYLTSSSHISLSLSLTCPLSHARAQPRSSFLYRSADSAHASSSPLLLLLLWLTPFLLLITQCLL